MAIITKIKWVILSVITLSVASIIIHLSLAKFWTVSILQYGAMTGFPEDFASTLGRQVIKNKKLWGAIESLENLQPYVNPRSSYSVPKEKKNNGFIYAKVFGGFAQIRSSICDLVAISRLLNATLVIPEIQQSTRSKGIRYVFKGFRTNLYAFVLYDIKYSLTLLLKDIQICITWAFNVSFSTKFKSFSYIYNEEQFIAYLKNDIIIAKTLPENLKERRRRRNEFPTFKLKSSTPPYFYIEEVLPKLKKSKVIGFIISSGGCLQSILPPSLSEIQRLRCRVAFHALQFRPEIKVVGQQMVNKLRALGQPFLVFHPGLLRDILAYHGCAELFQDVHTELIQHRRVQMIKEKLVNEELNIDSRLQRDKGLCPFMPEEVGILLRVMGYPTKTIVYIAGSETFGGQRALIPLRAMFSNLVDRTSLCSEKDLSDLVGPEAPLPLNVFQPPPVKSADKLKEEWKKAGPRPRPLPPPPDRPIYQHEKEGWYGWITETPTEPNPSPMDLRMQAHRLIWDALDYIISLEADAFFPGFNNDGSGWPDFSGLVMGHRLYESASSRTYRPDRKILAELLNITRDNIYHPKHNWTVLVQQHLNNSLGEEGLIGQSRSSKPAMFLSHPLPECSCRVTSAMPANRVKNKDGRFLFGDEEECPKWMKHASQAGSGTEGVIVEDNGLPDYESNDFVEESEFVKTGKTNLTLIWEQDEEMDPND